MHETNGSFLGRVCADHVREDLRKQLRVMWPLAAWAVLFVGAAQLLEGDRLAAGPISWVVAALPTVLLLLGLIAYVRYLRDVDELQRKIQLDGLALGFGGGWLVIAGYIPFEKLGAPPLEVEWVVVVMSVLFSVGVVFGQARYK